MPRLREKPCIVKTVDFQIFLFQWFCVVQLVVSVTGTEPYRAQCTREGEFNKPKKDYVLSNHVFATHSVTSRFECATFCLGNIRCKSYNYQYTGTDCQLNDASKTGLGTSLTSQAGYTYYENDPDSKSKTGCNGNPCVNGKCVDACDEWVCDCSSTPYKGRRCEEIDKTKKLDQSIILKNEPELRGKLVEWVNPGTSVWKLCYRGSKHGWTGKDFHVLCDRRGPTISIITVSQFIFGVFARKNFGWTSGYDRDANAFIFSLRNKDGLAPFKMKNSLKQYAIYNGNTAFAFGGGHDINIKLETRSLADSYSNLGHSYELPQGYVYGQTNAKSLLAGSYKFLLNEVEVLYKDEETLKENSEILKNENPSYLTNLLQWLNTTTRWRLCWRASASSPDYQTFHDNCDRKGPTVTLVKVGQNIFGGYTDQSWDGEVSTYAASHSSFIFSFVNNEGIAPFKANIRNGGESNAIRVGPYANGPTFGNGHDFTLQTGNSHSSYGISYLSHSGVSDGRTLLAGTHLFSPTKVEVFYEATDDLLYHSTILSQESQSMRVTMIEFLEGRTGWINCWRASKDGWAINGTFHSRCHRDQRTLILVKVGNYIFGGHSSLNWGSDAGYHADNNAFLFSLRNKEGLAPFKSLATVSPQHACYLATTYGPTFGGGHDLRLADNANANTHSYTNFGHSYAVPSGAVNKQTILAGDYRFTPTEIEVFYRID